MSITYKETEYPIAFDHTEHDLISYSEVQSTEKKKPSTSVYGNFEVVPNFKQGFETILVVGAMGSGKSYWCGQYMDAYKKLYPYNKVYIFSQKDSDPSFDRLKLRPRRVIIDDEFVSEPFELAHLPHYHHSLIIFDDFMTFSNKKYIEKLINVIMQFITLSRQYNCFTLITSHMFYGFNNRQLYASIQTEINKMVFFKGVNVYQLTYVIKNHFGHPVPFIKKLINFDPTSRYICISKFPQYVVSQHRCAIINEQFK